jgi:hypothetical protein
MVNEELWLKLLGLESFSYPDPEDEDAKAR